MGAIVSRAVFLPWSRIDADHLKKELTVKQYAMGEKVPTYIPAYEEYDDYLAVPRTYGLQLISKLGLTVSNQMSAGHAVKFPHVVRHIGEYAYQEDFVQNILDCCARHTDFIVQAATGKGKCLAKGTPVLMFDGRVLPVEKVRVGDRLMGPDSTPRTVGSLAHGEEEMFRVTPVKGDSYKVNRIFP